MASTHEVEIVMQVNAWLGDVLFSTVQTIERRWERLLYFCCWICTGFCLVSALRAGK